jgi:hypothetical protein
MKFVIILMFILLNIFISINRKKYHRRLKRRKQKQNADKHKQKNYSHKSYTE